MAEAGPTPESPKERMEQLERHYERCFASDDGKAVLADLMEECFVHRSTFVPGCQDATLINEGCRRVWLRIAAMTRMDVSRVYLERARRPAAKT